MQNLKGRNSVIARVVACCIVTKFLDDSVDSYLFFFFGGGGRDSFLAVCAKNLMIGRNIPLMLKVNKSTVLWLLLR